MLFQPKRIVRATTEQEIDSALATADQVVVEGDDQLLSYAVGKASADPQNKIAVETGEVTTTVTPTTDAAGQPIEETGRPRKAIFFFLSSLVVVAIVSIVFLVFATHVSDYLLGNMNQLRAPPPTASTGPVTGTLPSGPGTSGTPIIRGTSKPADDSTLTLVQTLVWPVVTIVSIIALFLIAWKAIAGGRNVEITWKVTEKVQGKVVITKQRAAAKPRRAVA